MNWLQKINDKSLISKRITFLIFYPFVLLLTFIVVLLESLAVFKNDFMENLRLELNKDTIKQGIRGGWLSQRDQIAYIIRDEKNKFYRKIKHKRYLPEIKKYKKRKKVINEGYRE